MKATSPVKLWAVIASVTSSRTRSASSPFGLGDTRSWSLHGTSRSRSCAAFAPAAVATSVLRGVHNLGSRRGTATTSASVVMTGQSQPAGSNAGTTTTTTTTTNGTGSASKPPKKRTFYRRTLKPPCVAFSSDEGRQLFREALFEGTMESYFRLAEQFRTQDEPAFCGLSTLTMVLNALAVDPGRVWKGAWRWYHESMLDCCAPLEVVKAKGVTLPTMCCLARCNGLMVTVAGPDTHSIEDLRSAVEECSTEDRGKVVVASYDRRGVNQTGTGHFSPIGGYHRGKDVVLVMDTARFKHPPHWVPMETLWEAMKRLDTETGKMRGFMVLEKALNLSHRLFTANPANYKNWPQVASWVNEIVEQASRAPGEKNCGYQDEGVAPVADYGSGMRGLRDSTTMTEFVPSLLALLPSVVTGLLTTIDSCRPESDRASDCGKCEEEKLQEEETIHDDSKFQDGVVLQALQGTEVYQELTRMERGRRTSSVSSADGVTPEAVAAVGRRGDAGGAKGPSAATATTKGAGSCGGKCGAAGAAATGAVAAFAPAGPSTPSPSSPSYFWAEEHDCGCSSRHVATILTYAFLLLLHKRDHEGNCSAGAGAGAGAGPGDANGDGGEDDGGLPEPLWRKDPLRLLPAPVANEVKHVAGMLKGLVEMENCEKCTQS
eukprot:g1795.t1